MAGTVVHLVIADKLLDKLNINNPALFYCGNLAPDAIMARKNYEREMKNHTHFKDGLKPYQFRIKENQEAYLKRFMDFYDEVYASFDKEDESEQDNNKMNKKDLIVGYLVHILVDELYLLHYYEKHLTRLTEAGKSFDDEDYARDYVFDVDQIDWELVRNYTFKYPMPDILWSEMDYEIPGWISNEELISSKAFIIHKNFELKHDKEELKVQSHKESDEFIELCVSAIPGVLCERFGIGS